MMQTRPATWIIGAVLLFAVLRCTYNDNSRQQEEQARLAAESASAAAAEAAMSPAARASIASARAAASAARAAEEIQFSAAVTFTRAVKASLHNPASFDLASAVRTDAGALCLAYRGTNAFNAVVMNYAVSTPSGAVFSGSGRDVSAAWKRHCQGKRGADLSLVRHAL